MAVAALLFLVVPVLGRLGTPNVSNSSVASNVTLANSTRWEPTAGMHHKKMSFFRHAVVKQLLRGTVMATHFQRGCL